MAGKENDDDDGGDALPPWALALIILAAVLVTIFIAFAFFKWWTHVREQVGEGGTTGNAHFQYQQGDGTNDDSYDEVDDSAIGNYMDMMDITCTDKDPDIIIKLNNAIRRSKTRNIASQLLDQFEEFTTRVHNMCA